MQIGPLDDIDHTFLVHRTERSDFHQHDRSPVCHCRRRQAAAISSKMLSRLLLIDHSG